MFTKISRIVTLFVAVAWFGLTPRTSMAFQQLNRNESWEKISEARKQNLPQTAIELIQPIIDSALADKQYAEAVKAIAVRALLESAKSGQNKEVGIRRIAQDLESAPAELKPMLHLLQAKWFWSYFETNRWQFGNRTAIQNPTNEDFTTWDLKRLFEQIHFHYGKALEAEESLKTIPIVQCEPFIEKAGLESLPDSYRPTLFDFAIFEAITFYGAGEQSGARPQDAFEINAASPALGPMSDFLAWKPETTDSTSPHLRAIQLFQKVIAFHLDDANADARLDADLGRLEFCHANAIGEEKTPRYMAALKAFINQNADHPLSATARYRLAHLLVEQNLYLQAREIAQQGHNAFPESVGGNNCLALIESIEAPSISGRSERVWSGPKSRIRVSYRNVKRVHFRLYAEDRTAELLKSEAGLYPFLTQEDESRLKLPPTFAFSSDLPDPGDFSEVTHDVSPPQGIKPGKYYLYGCIDEDFHDKSKSIFASAVWVTSLGLLIEQNGQNGSVTGIVVDNQSGTPIAGAKVSGFHVQEQEPSSKKLTTTTDETGRFAFRVSNTALYILAEHQGQMVDSNNAAYANEPYPPSPPNEQFTMFTDRAIYRPGQTISFKGVCLKANQVENKYQTVPNLAVVVNFHDPNGQVIATQNLKTNAYGSFHGSFVSPRDRGTGNMSLIINGQHSAIVQVEEYKRPKFEVKLEAPEQAPKLNGKVELTGKALSYTGMPIQGAKVRYRVSRTVRWPTWFSYCFPWRIPDGSGTAQEIIHGITTSEPDGTFRMEFTATPDRTVSEDDNPHFRYSIVADVTDTTGETRSASSIVSVGYVALQAELTAPEWKETSAPFGLTVTTKTLDGVPAPAKGFIKIQSLKQPTEVIRPDWLGAESTVANRNAMRGVRRPIGANMQPTIDSNTIATWDTDRAVQEMAFETKENGTHEFSIQLERGAYRAIVETQDRFGKPVTSILNFQVVDETKPDLGIKVPSLFLSPAWTIEPGNTFKAVWGTGYTSGRAFVEIVMGDKVLQSYWTDPKSTQSVIEQPITEEMRGGLSLRLVYVRENRNYMEQKNISVPWTNKELTIKTERFASKLEPGVKEKIRLSVSGPKASKAVAELVAAMYDASLDAYLPHNWTRWSHVFRQNYRWANWEYSNVPNSFAPVQWTGIGDQANFLKFIFPSYRRMTEQPDNHTLALLTRAPLESMMEFGQPFAMPGTEGLGGGGAMAKSTAVPGNTGEAEMSFFGDASVASTSAGPVVTPNLGQVSPRKNLQETAFFFPIVKAGPDGSFEMEFTMPEALTTWRFMAFAHDTELRSGYLEDKVITKRDIMVQPNPPRFLREGDELEFTVKVSNSSNVPQQGLLALKLFDPTGEKSVDADFHNSDREKPFSLAGGESRSYAWTLKVPDGSMPVIYKAVGATEKTSDGEEGVLPVLSRRLLVTESMPLPVRGKQTKSFSFPKLLDSGKSDSLKQESLTVQMVSQPAWYAVLALPYLMEYPHECSEQTFNRMYANLLARHIANRDPKIRRVFETWKTAQPDALDSPLQKNEDLKTVMIEETPWLRNAVSESQSRRDVAILFDDNRLNAEVDKATNKLIELQRPNGMWPWFPGGLDNEYLTLYIVTGYGRLRHLGVDMDVSPALRALAQLDSWMNLTYQNILKTSKNPEADHLSSSICLYLYGRSFFVKDHPIAEQHRVALQFWQRQAQNHWTSQSKQNQAQLAIGLSRLNEKSLPPKIVKSLLEFAKTSDEFGMYWEGNAQSWWWYHAPIETQAIMIEMLDEVAKDAKAVNECKVWLLKQKQTQAWKTTKSTADAIYALLLRGENLLASDALVEVKLGSSIIRPDKVEAGTGFFEQKFFRSEVKSEFGKISVQKTDSGVSWGSVHWQYLEDVSKIIPHDGTPLKLEKQIFRKVQTKAGSELQPVQGSVPVGAELVCRIVLGTDRDIEFVHLKDHRGSGTEPVNVLSGYRYQDGLGYYESTRDTASHFFIDYLRKGSYVFEYSLRVQHAGKYPSGMATVQCMYAPEFNSHSASIMLEVK